MFRKALVLVASLLLVSCGGGGGGGGGGSTSGTDIPTNQTPSIDPCNNTGGTVFAECMNTNYGHFFAGSFYPAWEPYSTSSPANQVQWSVVASGDSAHNNVLDVSFLSNDKIGLFAIGDETQAKDMSAYKTGVLSFDMQVLSWGDAYDPLSGKLALTFRAECVWPCAGHDADVAITTLNIWQHVEIQVADLVATGLDISKMNYLLQFSTLSRSQKGLHLQFDNIKYTKGAAAPASPKVIFKEDFNSRDLSNWMYVNESGNPKVDFYSDIGPFVVMNWTMSNQAFIWETTLPKSIDITNKTASYQIKCDSHANNSFAVNLVAIDSNGTVAYGPLTYGMDLPKDVWSGVILQLGNQFDSGFKPKSVEKVGLRFTSLGLNGVPSLCRVDTVRITD